MQSGKVTCYLRLPKTEIRIFSHPLREVKPVDQLQARIREVKPVDQLQARIREVKPVDQLQARIRTAFHNVASFSTRKIPMKSLRIVLESKT